MDLALYDPDYGYYARAAQRSGRAGDFFTSVDVGPLFGSLLELQLAEMADLAGGFDLVEAGAGNGRLAADVLRAARCRHPAFYRRVQLHLVEASRSARAEQEAMLADVAERLIESSARLPDRIAGVVFANELLDAMPVHQVVMRENGLREVYVDRRRGTEKAREDEGLILVEGPPSTPRLASYLDRVSAQLEPGWRAEINLRALDWIQEVAGRLDRGFVLVFDYGHEARELYSAGHSAGTLTTFARHSAASSADSTSPAWLVEPGERDITAHVDFTGIRMAAEDAGLTTIALLDQTYFLLGLATTHPDIVDAAAARAFKTLIMPGGLGSTLKVLILGKGVGMPALGGCSYRVRVT